jgi:hypothetical protein
MALSKVTIKVVWLKKLLHELGFYQNQPTIIYSDN